MTSGNGEVEFRECEAPGCRETFPVSSGSKGGRPRRCHSGACRMRAVRAQRAREAASEGSVGLGVPLRLCGHWWTA